MRKASKTSGVDLHCISLIIFVNCSHPLAEQQINAVDKVLSELDVSPIPKLIVWNKVLVNIFVGFSVLKIVY